MTLLDLTTPRRAARPARRRCPSRSSAPARSASPPPRNLVERGIDFVVYEAGDRIGASVAAVGPHPAVLAVEAPRRPGLAAPARGDRLGSCPTPSALPTGAELVEQYLAPLAALERDRRRASAPASTVDRRHPRGHGPHPHRRPRADPVPAARPHRRRRRGGHRPRRDRRLGHLPLARTASSSSGLDPLGLAEVADRVSHALPDVLGRERAPFAGRHTDGRRRRPLRRQHAAGPRRARRRRSPAPASPGSSATRSAVRVITSADDELAGRARRSAAASTRSSRPGAIDVVDRFEIVRARARTDERRRGSSDTARGEVVEPRHRPRRERDRLPPEPRHAARDPPRARRHRRGAQAPRAADRPERAHAAAPSSRTASPSSRTPSTSFFIVGMKSYGRAPTFLLATGYEQVRSVTAWLAGDTAAAANVELVLPGDRRVLDRRSAAGAAAAR